jgi:hypothetical protein
MSSHPFIHDHIGLGLLDAASIRRDGETWTADYPDTRGRPYLTVTVDQAGATIVERETDGSIIVRTRGRSLTEAIGQHGAAVLRGDPVLFWSRVARDGVAAWIPLTSDVRYAFVPSIGIGTLCVPRLPDEPLEAPAEGPLARRLGQTFDECDDGPVPARLLVTFASDGRQESWPIVVHRISVIGIVVPELVAAVLAVTGPIRGAEWRPWLETELQPVIGRRWPAPPRIGDPARHLAEHAIVEDPLVLAG